LESLGQKLKNAREEKGLSFDEISRETNIAGRYLEALEREDFAAFPGETYVLGFLRNYGETLSLNVPELLSLYRALKIQEQPIPVDTLLKEPSPLPRIIVTVLVILVLLGSIGAGLIFFLKRPGREASAAGARRAPAEYTMNTELLERRFYIGDSLLVPLGENQYKLELSNLGDALSITTPGGLTMLDLSQEVNVDLNNDGSGDLIITAADFAKNDTAAGALLRFQLSAGFQHAEASAPEGALPQETASPSSLSSSTVIFTAGGAYPFTLQTVFQGYCMFRWEILYERDRQGRNEQYFQRANELNIQANNGIRLWASNAQAAKINVIGGGQTAPLELGSAGEVVVADIRWVRDEENRYRLVMMRLE
jgi:cytoskeletal protein RodZ